MFNKDTSFNSCFYLKTIDREFKLFTVTDDERDLWVTGLQYAIMATE